MIDVEAQPFVFSLDPSQQAAIEMIRAQGAIVGWTAPLGALQSAVA